MSIWSNNFEGFGWGLGQSFPFALICLLGMSAIGCSGECSDGSIHARPRGIPSSENENILVKANVYICAECSVHIWRMKI